MSIYEPIETSDSRRHLQLRSPVTLENSGELVCANQEDVAAAIERADVKVAASCYCRVGAS